MYLYWWLFKLYEKRYDKCHLEFNKSPHLGSPHSARIHQVSVLNSSFYGCGGNRGPGTQETCSSEPHGGIHEQPRAWPQNWLFSGRVFQGLWFHQGITDRCLQNTILWDNFLSPSLVIINFLICSVCEDQMSYSNWRYTTHIIKTIQLRFSKSNHVAEPKRREFTFSFSEVKWKFSGPVWFVYRHTLKLFILLRCVFLSGTCPEYVCLINKALYRILTYFSPWLQIPISYQVVFQENVGQS